MDEDAEEYDEKEQEEEEEKEGDVEEEELSDNEAIETINESTSTMFQDISSLRNAVSIADLGRECTSLHHVYGMDMSKKGNMHMIDSDTIIYATSSAVVFENVLNGGKEFLLSIDDSGIGCVAVHPSR